MAEQRIICPNCRQEYSIPSDVTKADLTCMDCGNQMELAPFPQAAPVAAMAAGGASVLQCASGPLNMPEHFASPPLADLQPPPALDPFLHPPSAPDRDPTSIISGAVFLCVGSLMVGFQLFAPGLETYAYEYAIARNILAVAAVVLMAHSAAQDGIFRGLLCIVFPPYLLLYATSQEESGWLRGLFLGVMLGLCAEAFLLPDQSLVLELGPAVSAVIERVESWMALASRAPV